MRIQEKSASASLLEQEVRIAEQEFQIAHKHLARDRFGEGVATLGPPLEQAGDEQRSLALESEESGIEAAHGRPLPPEREAQILEEELRAFEDLGLEHSLLVGGARTLHELDKSPDG